MKIIGLTGPSGAGKGAVSHLFRVLYDIPAIDTDHVYHQLLLPPSDCLNALVSHFGKEILSENGTLCRPKLAQIVFSDETRQKQQLLNTITHQYILQKTKRILKKYENEGKRATIVDAPLLFESNFHRHCDCAATIAVLAPPGIRRERIMLRDQLSPEQADARLKMQKPDDFYRSQADYVIINDGDMAFLQTQVEKLAETLGVTPK